MELAMYLKCFAVGGLFCLVGGVGLCIGQLLARRANKSGLPNRGKTDTIN